MFQFKFYTTQSVLYPSDQAQGFTPLCPRAGCPLEREMGVRSWRVSCTHAWWGMWSRRSEISCSGGHLVGCCGHGGPGLDTHCWFLLHIHSRFRCCSRFGLRLCRPGHLPCGRLFRVLGTLRDGLQKGILFCEWSIGTVDDSVSDVVHTLLAQVSLCRVAGPLCFLFGRVACVGALLAVLVVLLCRGRPRFFPLGTAPVFRLLVNPPPQHRLIPRIGHPPEKWEPRTWRTVALIRSYAAYVKSAGTTYIALDLLGPVAAPRTVASRRLRWLIVLLTSQTFAPTKDDLGGREVLGGILVAKPGRNCVIPLTRTFRNSSSLWGFSGLPPRGFFNSSPTQQSSGSVKIWNFTPFPSRDRNALTPVRNPSFHGSIMNFSPLSWVGRPPA